jgi:phosphopantothenoylcysteine decarboxylase/phosphopantothenate--cysteine ligase
LWADIFLIAPATANEIAKMANGLCDNLLTATYLSAKCKVAIAPAMDLDMYIHPSTLANISKLKQYGNIIIDAEEGELASGLSGKGRLAEPINIFNIISQYFSKKQSLINKIILVTAGPTQEAIDPVRYISNHSSGKMGIAIAVELAERGANVKLVLGKTHISIQHPNIEVIPVISALDMFAACRDKFDIIDAAIFCAAVADYRVKDIATQKIKKNEDTFTIEMVKNPDIASEFGRLKKPFQVSIGFALETNNELENAQVKLKKKNFDFIVLNSTQDENATFGKENNTITIINKANEIKKYDNKPKIEVAKDIVDELELTFQKNQLSLGSMG